MQLKPWFPYLITNGAEFSVRKIVHMKLETRQKDFIVKYVWVRIHDLIIYAHNPFMYGQLFWLIYETVLSFVSLIRSQVLDETISQIRD